MKKILALTMILAAGIFALVGCSSNASTANGEFRIAAFGFMPPLTYTDSKNKLVGIESDLAKIMAADMGKKFKADVLDFDGLLTAVQSGTHDTTMVLTPNEARREIFDFTDIYLTQELRLIARSNDTRLDTCTTKEQIEAALDGKRIGGHQSSTHMAYIENIPGTIPVHYNDIALMLTALKNNQVDFIAWEFLVTDKGVATDLVQKNSTVKINNITLETSDIACAVKKGNTQLLDRMNATIRAVKADGRLDEIIAKHV